MKSTLRLFTVVGIILILSAASFAAGAQNPADATVNLTPAEKVWLAAHKTIRVGISPTLPPLKFSENNVIKGIEPDYLGLLAKKTGIHFEYVITSFSQMDAKVKSGDIDMFISFHIPERLAYMTFTEPLVEFKQVIVSRNDAPFISGIGALKGKKLATLKGVKLYDKLLASYPDIEVVPVDGMEQMFKAVSEFRADAFITKTFFAGYFINRYPNLKIAGVADLPPEPYLYAIRKDYPELVGILNKAITAIPQDQHDAIIQKWFNVRIEYRPNWSEILKWSSVLGTTFVVIIGLALYWNRRLMKEIEIRKKTEETLRESEFFFKESQRAASIGSYKTDFASGYWESSEVLDAIFGIGPDYRRSVQGWLDIVHPDDREMMDRHLREDVISKRMPFAKEYRIIRRNDGETRWVYGLGEVTFDSNGAILSLIGTIQDITGIKNSEAERLQLERQLLHAQKLESLGVLAGGIAHDFNNILASIVGNVDLALMKTPPDSPVIDNLQRIGHAADRAADLARQMLAYSGKGKFIVESIDMNRLLEEMLHMLEVFISKKVELHFNLAQNLPAIEADAAQIQQIVMNLVINASEAIGDRTGVIDVTTGFADYDACSPKGFWPGMDIPAGRYVCLEVADSGCGMDRDTLDKIFDPFFTTKFTGRGLGMAAVQGIVRGHKGAIHVDSEPDNGTSFKILLPASAKASEKGNREHHPEEWRGEGTVLLVDDEESIRNIASEMLRELGFDVITASDGREALAAFKAASCISFVILDLTMPHMDGEECFRELRKLNPNVKVIISSGYSAHEVTQKFTGTGLPGFIQKPYRLGVLKDTVRNFV